MFRAGFVICALLVLGGCASNFEYEFSENGCSTGKQSYENEQAMCDGLKSTSRNNGCALGSRQDHFKKNCGGNSFTPTN